ncbi:MAG: hypothetical protein EG822_09455 [Deltaproteobacteria bacterium]|nr:hypothetical protein [Deltaproteobacteria bacterium]TLN02871.1 MAG: hypothetical protein FDZ73_09820 [bacterium]
MKRLFLSTILMLFSFVSIAQALVYSGAMDSRAGQQHIPGFIAQSLAFKAGGGTGVGMRLEWQADNATAPGFWTYTYRLIRGSLKAKGFAFFDIETAADFTAANIVQREVSWATDRNDGDLPSGLSSITISDPANFNAVHDFSNAAVTEANFSLAALSKNDLSHYSGDPGIAAPGVPAGGASDTPSVGPVPHPFYGIRVTFPGSNADLAYEAVEWEFSITSDRAPMWGSFFGWADKTQISPFWYANFYNANIDNPVRLALPPANNLFGNPPYEGWILVPGPQVVAQPSRLTVDSATYQRLPGGNGTLTIFTTALSNAALTISGEGITPVAMTADTRASGSFSAQIPFTRLPSPIVISNSRDSVSVSPHPVIPVDEVTISLATYDPASRIMTIKAASGDSVLPLPTLTVPDFALPNTLDATGTLVKTLTTNPPNVITVKSSRGGTTSAKVTVLSPPPPPPAAINVAIIADQASPHVIGTPITFTATGSGESGIYEYRFWLNSGSGFEIVQDYSTTNTFVWNPVAIGAYDILVDVRNAGSTALREASEKIFFYQIQPASATAVSLTPDKASPQAPGSPIVFTAAGSGGSGNYEYRFWLNSGSGYTIVQNYSTLPTWTWTPSTAGNYDILVDVRSAGTTVERDAFNKLFFYQIQ